MSDPRDDENPSKSTSRIPNFLLSSALRVFLLRTIIVTLILCLVLDISVVYSVGIVIESVAIVHHGLSVVGPRIPFFVIGLDCILTIGEMVYFIRDLVIDDGFIGGLRWSGTVWVFGAFGYWGATLSISAMFLIKVLHIIDSQGRALLQRVNIAGDRLYSPPDSIDTANEGDLSGWWKHPVSVLTGRKVWESRISGEAHWYIISRGILAFCAMSSLIIYAAFQIILEPLGEMGLTPIIQLRAGVLPDSLNSLNDPVVWNLVLARPSIPGNPLINMVHVEPLWAPNPTDGSPLPGPPCVSVNTSVGFEVSARTADNFDVVVFHCPSRITLKNGLDKVVIPASPDDTRPTLLLTANFTGLEDESSRPGRDVIQVYLGLTNNTDDVISATRPSSLVRGTNVLAMAEAGIRQRLKPMQLATYGIFNLYETFLFSQMVYTDTDPFPPTSPSPDISTMRIGWQETLGEWTVIQDFRSKSILNGIAALGGLASVLSAIFAILFGTSLMRVVYRAKPDTPFGLLHQLESQQRDIGKGCSKDYPMMFGDLQALKEKPGLFAFLLDTLIDVDLLKRNVTASTNHAVESEKGSNVKKQVSSGSGLSEFDRLDFSEHKV